MGHLFSPRNDHVVVIRAERRGLGPEVFTDLALDVVSLHGHAPSFQGNTHPKMPEIIRHPKDCAFGQANNLTAIKEPPVLPRIVEAFGRTKRMRARTRGGRNELLTGDRDGKAFAAFRAAAFQDNAAIGGFHALEKAMAATAFSTARLECAFHRFKTLTDPAK